MKPHRFWTILAFLQLALFVALWSCLSPNIRDTILCDVWLVFIAHALLAPTILICVVLTTAIALTFIAHALRNTRLGWGMRVWWAAAFLLFSAALTPVYWLIHLRRP